MKQRSFFLLSDRGNGELDLFWLRNDDDVLVPRPFPRALPFADPTTDDDRSELRWYQEQALSRPLPAERERARRVEERMQTLGSRLFQQVFRIHDEQPDPRTFYGEAVADGLEGCELRIVSDDPRFLSIPWELLYDSAQGFLVQSLAGLYRQPLEQAPAPLPADPATPLRVLLVAPRPDRPDHAPGRTIARALPRAVRELWPRVQIDLLRPPTLAALRQQLNQQPGAYQVVHVDGHAGAGQRQVVEQVEAAGPGVPAGTVTATVHESRLLFEGPEGRPEPVSAERLASVLVEQAVPLVVVSPSAADDDERPHTILAAQLIQAGVPAVLVLPYALDAGAAERLLRPLYTRPLGGASLAEAVTEGRRALAAERRRSSAVGPLTLEDWGVPMLYQHSPDLRLVRPTDEPSRHDADADLAPESGQATGSSTEPSRPEPGRTAAATAQVAPAPAVPHEIARIRQHVAEVCRPGRLGLLGREADLLRIDRALGERQQPWALLTGPAGIGKSALALDFGRWYYETGGCPGGVFVTSFRSRADFGQVLGSVVSQREEFFGRHNPAERPQRLVEHLRATRCLLILDDFETVGGHGTGESPLANERDRRDLGEFLFALRGGQSRVLITGRNPDEGWLGISPVAVRLGRLTGRPAGIMAAVILRGVGRDAADFQRDRDYGRLLELLEGHPRAIEVVMPQLRSLAPAQLIDAFRNIDATTADRLETFQSFAFEQLSATARRHLPATALFNGVINADLGAMLFPPGGPRPDGYAAIVGEAPDRAGWRAILAEAAGAGLVRDLGRARYQIPATLQPLLRRRLMAQVGQAGVRALDRELIDFYAALAGKLAEGVHRGDASAVSLLTFEEPNLVRVLRAADHVPDRAGPR